MNYGDTCKLKIAERNSVWKYFMNNPEKIQTVVRLYNEKNYYRNCISCTVVKSQKGSPTNKKLVHSNHEVPNIIQNSETKTEQEFFLKTQDSNAPANSPKKSI